MSEPSTAVPKPRKLWIESTPFTPPSYPSEQSCSDGDHISPARVRLTHFTKKPVIDFGCVKTGKTVTRKLVVENPNPYEVEVYVEKFPWKDFQINEKKFWVPEESFQHVEISWTPSTSGNYREMVMIKYDSSFRVHVLLVGHVETPKKKKTGRAFRRNIGRTPRRSIKPNPAESQKNGCDPHKENEENINPVKIQPENGSGGPMEKKGSPEKAYNKEMSPHPTWSPKMRENFRTLRASMLPLHVLNNNPRDSSGSITAPTSPSGLEVPIIEDHPPSPLVDSAELASSTATFQNAGSPLENPSRSTFCLDSTSVNSVHASQFSEQSLTGRPTFLLPQESNDTRLAAPTTGANVQNSADASKDHCPSASDGKGMPLTPRSHRRSQTFNTEDGCGKPHPGKQRSAVIENTINTTVDKTISDKKMSMLDYALSVIAEPLQNSADAMNRAKSRSSESSPDDSLNSSGSSHAERAGKVNGDKLSAIEIGTKKYLSTVPTIEYDASHLVALQDQLSSTCMHEQTSHDDQVGCLPAPDVSAITCPAVSPKKLSKRKSPLSNSFPPFPKRAAIEDGETSPSFVSPARRTARYAIPGANGTPKGRALQRRRAAKLGGEVKKTLKVTPKNRPKGRNSAAAKSRSHSGSSPSFLGAKRGGKSQEKSKLVKKRKVKAPPTRLILRTSQVSQNQPARVPLPFSSRNMFYDATWWVKQENAYTCWLNYILTPDEFKPSLTTSDNTEKGNKCNKTKSFRHSAVFGRGAEKSSLSMPALSKEAASLRAYQMQRRLNRLRRAACKLFESDALITVIRRIEEEVDIGRIKVRNDKQLWADLGNRTHVLGLLLSFNPLWLRVGLEATFGEALPLAHGNGDMVGISNFISRRLLNCDEIKREFAHPTVPNLFKPGYEDRIAKHTLKKFLILIFFLDQAKQHHLIDHDPCLFRTESNVKSCRDILVSFSRDLLRGEGDIIKHLSFFGYKTGHTQTFIDEFEFGISNIAVDLRDGIRLVRIVELLFLRHNLMPKLRVPAGSILQKRHNAGVALKALEDHNVNIFDASGKKVDPDHIVKGHREMTLALLWNIAAHFQLVKGIDRELVRGEITFLKKNLRVKHMLENTKNFYEEEEAAREKPKSSSDEISSLLLEWCRLVCAFKSIPVYNFATSFADGRVLACLVSYYQSDLIHPSQIRMATTLSQREPDPRLDDSALFDLMQDEDSTPQIPNSELLKNERINLKLVQRAAYELGGIPNLLRIDDISNTIPDDKVVRLLVSFLCVRLLDIRIEDRAARTIQVTWRAYNFQKKAREEKRAAEEEKRRRDRAVAKIQAAYRRIRQQRKYEAIKYAALMVQRMWRAKKATQPFRREFLKLKTAAVCFQAVFRGRLARRTVDLMREEKRLQNVAAIKIQTFWRGKMAQMLVIFIRKDRRCQREAATKIQAFWRGRTQQSVYNKQRESSAKLQSWYRAVIIGRQQKKEFVDYKQAVVKVQRRWRATMEARKQVAIYSTKKEAAIVIQRSFRSYRKRKIKAEIDRRWHAATVIQRRWWANLAMKVERRSFLRKCSASVVVQCALRRYLALKFVKKQREQLKSVKLIQKWWRATSKMLEEREVFLSKRKSAIVIQCMIRRHLAVKKAIARREAVLVLQQKWKATLQMKSEMSRFLEIRSAAITLQCTVRGFLARKIFRRMWLEHRSALILQRRWKGTLLMRIQRAAFCQKREAALTMQCAFRCYIAKKILDVKWKTTNAAITIQMRWKATMRMRLRRKMYLEKRLSAAAIQRAFRCYAAKKLLAKKRKERDAAVVIQRKWKATKLMRLQLEEFCQQRYSTMTIQRAFRCYVAKTMLEEKRQRRDAAVTLQKRWGALKLMRIQRAEFLQKRVSALAVQRAFRCYVARKVLATKRRRRGAAVLIQRKWRATKLMQLQRAYFCRARAASVTIQCAFRCYVAKKMLMEKRQRRDAAIFVQRKWRATRAMHAQRDQFVRLRFSAAVIQRAFRCYVARKLLLQKRSQKAAAIVIQMKWRAAILMKAQRADFVGKRNAVTAIQRAFRCYRARMMLKAKRRQRDAAIAIQRKWRATLCMQIERADYRNKQAAAVVVQCALRCYKAKQLLHDKQMRTRAVITIQRKWRATLAMKRDHADFHQKRAAVTVIQYAFRGYTARKLLEMKRNRRDAAITIQRKWKATMCMQIQKAEFGKKRSAAKTIQSAFRCYAARKVLEEKRQRRNATVIVQRKWRATLLMRIKQAEFYQTRIAVGVIQRSFRRFVAKRMLEEKRNRRDSAIIIQRRWKATKWMRIQRDEFSKKRSSAIRIQCAFRCYRARKVSNQKRLIRSAVVVIQRKFRATKLMWTERALFQQKYDAIITVQLSFRCYKAKRLLEDERNRNFAAVIIQQQWRARKSMKALRAAYLRKRSAAVVIQRGIRRHQEEKRAQMERNRQCAAITLQNWWSATRSMRRQRNDYDALRSSVFVIQRGVRCFLAKRLLARKVQEFNAAVIVQRKWRAALSMRKCRQRYRETRFAAIVVQSAIRRRLAIKLLKVMRERHNAAVIIQRRWLATKLMRKQRSAFLQQRNAATVTQRALRCMLARKLLSRRLLEKKAAIAIQARWRATIQMRRQRFAYLKTYFAVIVVQSVVRRFLATKMATALRNLLKAIVKIQQRWRANALMKQERSAFLRKRAAVIITQNAVRRMLARKLALKKRADLQAAEEHRIRHDAADVIQNWWKATAEMTRDRRRYKTQRCAALVLQRAFRHQQAVKTLANLRRERNALLTLQRSWRATLLMRKQRNAFLETRASIITTQSCVRRFLALKHAEEKRKMIKAALVTQQRWKATLRMRTQRAAYLKTRGATVVIQSVWRKYAQRKMTAQRRKEMRSAVLLQRWWRACMEMKTARSRFLRIRSAVITIQAAVRVHFAARLAAVKLAKQKLHSAILIQRMYRGYQARKRMMMYDAITKARLRCIKANQNARQNPELQIGRRMNNALDILLSLNVYSQIYDALETIYDLSCLLPECCERISDAGGSEVLCKLINSTNRSFCGKTVYRQSLNILLNLIQNPSTRARTMQTLQDKHALRDEGRSESTTPTGLLVSILSRFRENGQRDRDHVPIFCAACCLLIEFCFEPGNLELLESDKRLINGIRFIRRETERQHSQKIKRDRTHSFKRQRDCIGYISLSSTVCEEPTSASRTGHFLDVSTRETSFLLGHKRSSKSSSTPKSKNKKPGAGTPTKPRSADVKKVVKSLYPGASVPPKVKQSIVPQRTALNTGVAGVPIHRSKKVTKPQSPKLHGLKPKLKVAPLREQNGKATNGAQEASGTSNPAKKGACIAVMHASRKKTKLLQRDPLGCIRELCEFFE